MAATFLVDAPVFDHYAGIDTTTLLIERSGLFAAYLRPKYVYSNHLLQSAGLSPPSHRVLPQRGDWVTGRSAQWREHCTLYWASLCDG